MKVTKRGKAVYRHIDIEVDYARYWFTENGKKKYKVEVTKPDGSKVSMSESYFNSVFVYLN